jgi:recombination protein RecA
MSPREIMRRAPNLLFSGASLLDARNHAPARTLHARDSPLQALDTAHDTMSRLSGAPEWRWEDLAGRLVELSGAGDTAVLTLAMELVRDAQLRREMVAWITTRESSFYPPDAAANGIDLEALVVVRAPSAAGGGRDAKPSPARHDVASAAGGKRRRTASQAARAADRLVRSGSFGLVVLDMLSAETLSLAEQGRLLQLAEKHHCPIVCLTEKHADAPSLGSLVGLRAQARRERNACSLEILKDKRGRSPNAPRAVRKFYHAPPGMR